MTSNDAIAGSDASCGSTGLWLKSVWTFTLFAEIAYSARDGEKAPVSSVDDGATTRLAAPSTETSSRTLAPRSTSPSTS